MVYKKYIKKDGKLYGPYIYESKRIDGKVVSEYHGPKKGIELKKFDWIFVSVILALFFVYFLSMSSFDGLSSNFGGITGNAILNAEVNSTERQPITGNVNIFLKQGELIPSSSKFILENSGQKYEYNLNQLVSNEPVTGEFYIEGLSLSGSGEGYGIKGEKQGYPEVSFILQTYSAVNESETNQAEDNTPSEEVEINTGDFSNETVQEESTTSEISEDTETITSEESGISEPESVSVTETITDENNADSEQISDESAADAANTEIVETETVESTESSEPETSSITGFFVKIYNFFLLLTPTGNAISESNEISGETSFDKPYEYNLSKGEAVQLKPGSVSASGEMISDDNIKIISNGNKIIVETSYAGTEKGFGAEYTGNNEEILNINLSELGLILEEGELTIKIVNDNDEILSAKTLLVSGRTSVSENISNSTIITAVIEQNNISLAEPEPLKINQENLQIINAETASLVLTEEEKALLSEEFGSDITPKPTEPELINGRLIGKYELGSQWIGYSYDANLTEENLKYQMSIDMMKWLKDLAYRLKVDKNRLQ